MIRKMKLSNFSAFKEINLEFSPKINLIIGENGMGKTHLLKLAYCLSYGGTIVKEHLGNAEITTETLEEKLTEKFLGVFTPLDGKLGRLKRRGTSSSCRAYIQALFDQDNGVSIEFNSNSKNISITDNKSYSQLAKESIFIPTKEILSLLRSRDSVATIREMIAGLFDHTYVDLLDSLLVPSSGSEKLDRIDFDPRYGSVLASLVRTIGGLYHIEDGEYCFQEGFFEERLIPGQRKYGTETETIFRKNGVKTSNNMTAEGFRKLGLLQHLILNSELNPGVSGTLFWDEPESNMNPFLVKELVKMLLVLSRNGQQIVLTTHDYTLLKWFDLLSDPEGFEDHVMFHSLYKNDSGEINSLSVTKYDLIPENAIADSFSALYDAEVNRALGGE